MPQQDWSPRHYLAFSDLRLRPALDLLHALPGLPPGDVVDLGCGAGTVGPALAERFPGHRLIGVDLSSAMLERAREVRAYDSLVEADIAEWMPDRRPALIYSNAALHWLPEHGVLFPRLARDLTPGGILAVQMPRQHYSRAHELLRERAAALFPDRFDYSRWQPSVARPEDYEILLSPLGELALWETIYHQRLTQGAEQGHPVRLFSQSTAARPVLEKLDEAEAVRFLTDFDAALAAEYPIRPDGSVLYPFWRLFLVLTRPG